MSGKGSTPRPFSVDAETFADNWQRIFGAKSDDSSITEASRNGGQGTAQDGRQAEGDAE